jgi:hypothetical protein
MSPCKSADCSAYSDVEEVLWDLVRRIFASVVMPAGVSEQMTIELKQHNALMKFPK